MIIKLLKKIKQIIIINFFFLIYGKIKKIKTIKEVINSKTIKVNFLNNVNYNLYEIENPRLYTDTIDYSAVVVDNNLVKEPSYQFKNSNFSSINNNIVLNIGTPKFLKKLHGVTFSMLTGGGGNENYFHWLFDVLPRIEILKKKFNIKKINFFLVPSIKKKFQLESLKILNIKKRNIISSKKYQHISSNKIIISDHPYRFSKNKTQDVENIPSWISLWLKKSFLKKNNKFKFKKIYIEREKIKISRFSRSIINEERVKNFLQNNGFKCIKLENYSITDQANIFNNADIVVGLHGAGFANLAFCKKKTKILEMKSVTTNNQIKNIAKNNGLKYYELIGSSKNKTFAQQGNLYIPLKTLKKKN